MDGDALPGLAARIEFNVGNSARRAERWEEALARYTSAIERTGGGFLPARTNQIVTLIALGRLDEALTGTSALVADAPELASSWHQHGIVLAKRGVYGDAIEAFSRALEVDYQSPNSAAYRDRARELLEAPD